MVSEKYNATLCLAAAVATFATITSAQGTSLNQFSQTAVISGGNELLGYKLSPEWSEDLGFSLSGHYGIVTGQNTAFGMIARVGENVTEGLVNVGFTFGAYYDIILSAGKLRERLPINEAASHEWIGQNEFGATLKRDGLTANVYITDSESTGNYVGARSIGADFGAEQALSSAMTLSSRIGYQRINWDDGRAIDTGVTGSIGLSIAAGDNAMFKFNAGQNLSERTFGIQSTWNLGLGSLGAGYTQIKGRNGARADDSRVQVTYSMPLGAKSSKRQLAHSLVNLGPKNSNSNSILADVMRRPDYLPKRVIAKVKPNATSVCAAYTIDEVSDSSGFNGFTGLVVDHYALVIVIKLISSDPTLSPYPASVSGTLDTLPLVQPSGLYGLRVARVDDLEDYLFYERRGIDDTITFNIGSVECQLSAEVWYFSP